VQLPTETEVPQLPTEIETSSLITEAEVCKRLGVKKSCLRRWRHERRGLPFVRVGRLVRYRTRDIEQFIVDHMQDVKPKESAVSR
jgi:excisionase family DNA binding protein